MTARNAGTVALTPVVPGALAVAGDGGAVLETGPSPGSASLAPGASAAFTWVYRATVPGTITFQGTASGAYGSVVTAVTVSNPVRINIPLGRVTPYPNPYRPGHAVRGTVKFAGLTAGMTLRLYTVRGFKVWEGVGGDSGTAEWNGRNDRGEMVAPGTYLWVAEGAGRRERGTLIVE
jgi:hypothetical protein